MGGGGSQASFDNGGGYQGVLDNSAVRKLFVAVNDTTAETVTVDSKAIDQVYSNDGYRDWIEAI